MSTFNDKENSSWGEYSKLVLNQIESLQEEQKVLRKEISDKINELSSKINELNSLQKEISEVKVWKERVQDVWSVTQMKEGKDELYRQKNKWYIVIGILSAIQVLWALFTFFGKNSF